MARAAPQGPPRRGARPVHRLVPDKAKKQWVPRPPAQGRSSSMTMMTCRCRRLAALCWTTTTTCRSQRRFRRRPHRRPSHRHRRHPFNSQTRMTICPFRRPLRQATRGWPPPHRYASMTMMMISSLPGHHPPPRNPARRRWEMTFSTAGRMCGLPFGELVCLQVTNR